jgi:hypothetical protein
MGGRDVPASAVELTIDAPGYQPQRRSLAPGDGVLDVTLKRRR